MASGYTIWFFILGLVLPFICFNLPLNMGAGGVGVIFGLGIFLVCLTVHYHFAVPALNAFTSALLLVVGFRALWWIYKK